MRKAFISFLSLTISETNIPSFFLLVILYLILLYVINPLLLERYSEKSGHVWQCRCLLSICSFAGIKLSPQVVFSGVLPAFGK